MLKDNPVEIISNSPTVILLGDVLFFVEDIDGKKLLPFLSRDRVLIPEGFEEKYFASFIRSTLRDYHAITRGFEVIPLEPQKKAELVLEMGISQKPVWILSFHYNNHHIHPDSPLRRFVNYLGKKKGHAFERFERDEGWEQQIMAMLNEVGLHSRDEKNYYLNKEYDPKDEGLYPAVSFMNEYGSSLKEFGIAIRHRLNRDYYLDKIELDLESTEKEDWFDVLAVVRFREPFSLHRIERSYSGRKEGIRLTRWESGHSSRRMVCQVSLHVRIWHLVGKKHQNTEATFFGSDGSLKGFHAATLDKLEALNQVDTLPDTDLPEGLNATLRTYQTEGYHWLSLLQRYGFGGCLADDMGLGKTLQAIAILLRSRELRLQAGENKPTSLVVLPASLLHNWSNECSKFAPKMKVLLHVGMQRNRQLSNFSYYDLVLSTYHTVRQDIETMASFHFHYIILDESQMIKNPSSKSRSFDAGSAIGA